MRLASTNDVVHTSADLLSGVVGYLCACVHVISPEEVPGYAGAAHQDLTHLLFGDTEARDNIPSQHIFCPLTRKPLFVAIRFSLLWESCSIFNLCSPPRMCVSNVWRYMNRLHEYDYERKSESVKWSLLYLQSWGWEKKVDAMLTFWSQ